MPSTAAFSTFPAVITSLNRNDVLLGRGTGPSEYVGNKLFRKHVHTRREEYVGCESMFDKGRIAQEVVDHVHSLGGRFVRQERKGRRVGDLLVDGLWREEKDSVAIEKCKQALRDKSAGGPKEEFSMQESACEEREGTLSSEEIPTDSYGRGLEDKSASVISPPPVNDSWQDPPPIPSVPLPVPYAADTAPMLYDNMQNTATDPRLLFYHQGLALRPPIPLQTYQQLSFNGMLPFPNVHPFRVPQRLQPVQSMNILRMHQGDNTLQLPIQEATPLASVATKKHSREDSVAVRIEESKGEVMPEARKVPTSRSIPASVKSSSSRTKEDEAAAFLLSSLAGIDRPVISDEQAEKERAALTDRERAAALSDLFGELNVNEKKKRAKRDLDRKSIEFLVQQMKLEIDRIPKSKRAAMADAQKKCSADEFCDARLEQFLRCEGMNAEVCRAWNVTPQMITLLLAMLS